MKQLAYFLLPILVLLLTAEFALRQIPNKCKIEATYLNENASKVEVLIMGNSHAYYGLDTKKFKMNAFNAAYVCQTLHYDFKILKKYQSKLTHLKYIVLPIENFSFRQDPLPMQAAVLPYYSVFLGINESFDPSRLFLVTQGKTTEIVSKIKRYYFTKQSDSLRYDQFGNGEMSNSFLRTKELLISKKNFLANTNYNDGKWVEQNRQTLEQIVELANQMGAKILFITFPINKDYLLGIDQLQLKEALTNIQSVVQKDPRHLKWANFYGSSKFSYTDFSDFDHLNRDGRSKLTVQVDSILNNFN